MRWVKFMFLGTSDDRGCVRRRVSGIFHVSVEKIYGRVIEKYIRQGLLEKMKDGRTFLPGEGFM